MKISQVTWILTVLSFFGVVTAQAQFCIEDPPGSGNYQNIGGGNCITTIQTAVPFLTIVPDARSAAMGDIGIAASPTTASAYFNASALAFSQESFEVSATFTPWLRALNLEDVYLANLNMYGRISDTETLFGSLRYFSLGQIDFTDINGNLISVGKPYEMAASAGYARKLSEKLSASLTGRFILSSLASGLIVDGQEIGNGFAGAADLGFTYNDNVSIANGAFLRVGASVRNIGSKITYSNSTDRDFLPTNLGVGATLETFFDEFNSLTVGIEFNKLLVPSPRPADTIAAPQQSPIQGIFSSFGDAQGGFNEELREINLGFGVEYWYAGQFAARAGYFHEPTTKGGRQYLTLGVGIKYNVLGLDFSYLIPTTATRNPLDNTLRFGLTYTFRNEDPSAGG